MAADGDKKTGDLHRLNDGGNTGTHFAPAANPVLVGPSTDDQHNVISTSVIPIACWRVDDLRFEFDSSFVRPELSNEIGHLATLRDSHKIQIETGAEGDPPVSIFPPLSIFGHADPVGSDDYNKKLSGRRTIAIYALFTRKTELWEELFSQPLGNDDWNKKALPIMEQTLKVPKGSASGRSGRAKLFRDYMDFVCTLRNDKGDPKSDPDGNPLQFQLEPADFLARGRDKGGKGDFQGCGEFNPVLLLSEADSQELDQDGNEDARNAANAQNRRVMVLLFRPGTKVDPAKWPCPRAREGVAGCRKRFWSDGEKRRTERLPDDPRRFEETKDTFACRFYHRISSTSPCERLLQEAHISLLLRSNSGAAPLVKVSYKIHLGGGQVLTGTTDEEGFLSHAGVPPGDYKMEIEGFESDILVPTVPLHIERRLTRIGGAFLMPESLSQADPPQDDPNADGPHRKHSLVDEPQGPPV